MAKVAIIHPRFDTKGGAEVVCFNVIEALQEDHDLFLFSFDEPNFNDLNEFCSTNVDPIPNWHPETLRRTVNITLSRLNGLTDDRFGTHNKLLTSILNRMVAPRMDDFDVSVCTGGEMALPKPSVQYVHLPIFMGRYDPEYGARSVLGAPHDWICSRIAGINRKAIKNATLLTNSEWTADVVSQRYGIRPDVVAPPTNVEDFYEVPWAQREDGFVTAGRISPDKRTLEIIDILEDVRKLGHKFHLHIVGPTDDHNESYRRRVGEASREREWVFIEDELPRSEFVDLICNHKYGIHGKRAEHFGIAVAELVLGGTLPFVPADGGQVDLVGNQSELTYRTSKDAVSRIDAVLSNPRNQMNLIDNLPTLTDLNSNRFKREIRNYVENAIDSLAFDHTESH